MNPQPIWSTLRFSGLVSGYQGTRVLRGISGGVTPGEVLGVVGRNGVGKSTLLRTLAGIVEPDEGTIEISNTSGAVVPLGGVPVSRRRHLGISYAPQEQIVFDDLTVADNLTLGRKSRDLKTFDAAFTRFPRLRERIAQPAGKMSGGEKKILSFVRVLAEASPITLIDEPTEGVAQENLDLMAASIDERKRTGAAFVIVEQNLQFLLSIADSILVLDHGEAVDSGCAHKFTRARLERYLVV
ncbi:ABC transporter ATP-binding protein [Paraburkholderia sp. ZP32-5]|uniref:ABC transporter ATP-binding protein n=1 Tax=Paraburkholderia sp. ZP32-5 TaxID=2883245 RepID=UPI001F1C0315|nr:ATP-binding cassette domain-containing protein [Paraburkholderia sp. ZP32-5]